MGRKKNAKQKRQRTNDAETVERENGDFEREPEPQSPKEPEPRQDEDPGAQEKETGPGGEGL